MLNFASMLFALLLEMIHIGSNEYTIIMQNQSIWDNERQPDTSWHMEKIIKVRDKKKDGFTHKGIAGWLSSRVNTLPLMVPCHQE